MTLIVIVSVFSLLIVAFKIYPIAWHYLMRRKYRPELVSHLCKVKYWL